MRTVFVVSIVLGGCGIVEPEPEPVPRRDAGQIMAAGGAGGGTSTGGGSGGGTSTGGGSGGGTSTDAGADAGTNADAGTGWLQRPFQGEFRVSNFFDHDIPRQFVDMNGRQTTFWGEASTFIDGHDGYDFVMPEGTPLIASADGVVQFAGDEPPFFCPLLNRMASATIARIEVTRPDGSVYLVEYVHLSRLDVAVGQRVTVGQRIGLSGNTGCSTGAHLHFEVQRPMGAAAAKSVDPFGWEGAGTDPWVTAGGPVSEFLWVPSEAPPLYRQAEGTLTSNTGSWVGLTKVRWMGVRDDTTPNNEFVEISRDERFAPASVSLTGYSLRNLAGETVPLPGGTLSAANPMVRVFTGAGTSTGSTLYLGRTTPLWSNRGDCARLVFPNSNAWSLYFGRNDCP